MARVSIDARRQSEVAKRVEDTLHTIRLLSQVLLDNGGYKGAPDDCDNPAQIDDLGECGIQQAISLLASSAHRDFCQLATDLGIPQ
ncbi:hypothetical protein PMM47T1_24114 [Pseudomonas sp. M47T1]|uniref:hypothetical protein n=1 Tax=Pseudomonas sp. M47T1 TaxID=1179778 RepID=UPI0002607DFE|nr:hypothetical protein [Pseudomonas sp. M47T1]EIK94035.1 hypothetical protein PMM47T1_24114 [Pseudomonas sp. M47T1]